MPYVYIDPADYVTGKSISFEEYRQLIDNAEAAYQLGLAGGPKGEVIATYSTVTAVGVTMVDSTGPVYTFVVPAGVNGMEVEAVGGGSGVGLVFSSEPWGGYGGGASMKRITVVPGETITITIGVGGGYQTNGGNTTIVGSVSGTLATAGGGQKGPSGTGGTAEGAGLIGGAGVFTTGSTSASGGAANGGTAFQASNIPGYGRYGRGGYDTSTTGVATGYGSGGGGNGSSNTPGTPGIAILRW